MIQKKVRSWGLSEGKGGILFMVLIGSGHWAIDWLVRRMIACWNGH